MPARMTSVRSAGESFSNSSAVQSFPSARWSCYLASATPPVTRSSPPNRARWAIRSLSVNVETSARWPPGTHGLKERAGSACQRTATHELQAA